MALRALGRKGSKKLSSLFSPSKHNSNAPSEPSKENTQNSLPLIERQRISPELESEIRYACALLYYSIEHEELTQFSQDVQPTAQLESKAAMKVTSTEYLLNSQESRHDSGIGLEGQHQQQQPNSYGIPRFYRQHNSASLLGTYSEATTATGSPTCRSVSMSSDHQQRLLDSDNRQGDEESIQEESHFNFRNLCDRAFRTSRHSRPELDTMPDDGKVSLNADTQSQVPSFYWPEAGSRLNSPQKTDRHKEPSRTVVSKPNPVAPGTGTLSPYPSPTDIASSPASAIGMGATVHRKKENEEADVVIGRDGLMRVMSAAEATQRQIDLQRAVMEKMCTGVIGASSQVTELHLDGSSSNSEASKSEKARISMQGEENEQQQQQQQPSLENNPSTGDPRQPQRTKSSLMRKLSMLGIGRRKTVASGSRDTMGFNRIFEAGR